MPKERKNPPAQVEQIQMDGAGISARRNQICQSCFPVFSLALLLPLLHHLKYGLLLSLKFLIFLCSGLTRQQYTIKFPQQLSDGTCKRGMDLLDKIQNLPSVAYPGVGDEQFLQGGVTGCAAATGWWLLTS